MLHVLVADDDEIVRESVAGALVRAGHRVAEAEDGAKAASLLALQAFDVAICDLRMPHIDGLTLMRRIRRDAPGTAVVLMTTYGRLPDMVGSLHDEGVDYVMKPFDPEQFTQWIVEPLAARRPRLRKLGAASGPGEPTLVARSPAMAHLAERIVALARTDLSILVTGGEGAGKELVARLLHVAGSRREGPLGLLDGRSLPETILAAEWSDLGDDGGARDAWFREAATGTLVLDGIERLSRTEQAHLLRVIDDPATGARGTADWEPKGVRLVTLTREDLGERVVAGELLEELYYRLDGARLHVPSLRERREDLRPLAVELLRELGATAATERRISPAAWSVLEDHPFPGNVRELRCILELALARAGGGPIELNHLPAGAVTT
jgi:DNA-binding NtrC family response regulator